MSKIRSPNELQNILDGDFSWRLKEIASLKLIVRGTSQINKKTAIRASIPLLYGHWEGFIKNSATNYLSYVNGRSLKYSELKSCFIVFGVKKKITELSNSKTSNISIAALEFLQKELTTTANLKIESAIRTEFNLSSEVFSIF